MTQRRPELGAELNHLCVRSSDPLRLARFYVNTFGMDRHPIPGGWHCAAPGRAILVKSGRSNSVEFFAYAFADRAAFTEYRRRIQPLPLTLRPNPSPLFDGTAFGVTDPDGNVVAFGRSMGADVPADDLPARLQHIALRTPSLERMIAFYSDMLGFVVSDCVQDAQGTLRACFMRTNHEHHSLALFGAAGTRLDHISSETRNVGDLTAWADRVAGVRVPLHWGIGRHGPGNDLFFLVMDPDENLIEISTELERCDAQRPAGVWPHELRTLNLWGAAIDRNGIIAEQPVR
jgi:catechol 2,3-dioxygenase-like lactoylglutathione lyase family enzyme